MKKVLKYSLFLLASAALFTACGEKDNDPSETPSGGGSISSPEKKIKSIQTTPSNWTLVPRKVSFEWEGDLMKLVHFDGEQVYGSMIFSYNGATGATVNYPRKESDPSYFNYCNIRYDGDRVIEQEWRKYIDEDSSIHTYSYSYADGSIAGVDYMWKKWDHKYRRSDENYYREGSERLPMTFEKGNLVLYGSKSSSEGSIRYVEISYDDKKSPFPLRAKTSNELVWMREAYNGGELFVFFFPWSDHNITSIEAVNDNEYRRTTLTCIYNYTYDELGYPASVDVQVKEEVHEHYNGTTATRERTYTLTYQYYE